MVKGPSLSHNGAEMPDDPNAHPDLQRPPGRRARKAAAVRRALFDAGLAAFERQPMGLVSILDITEAADVAKGVFYLQFRGKDDFLIALWQDRQRVFLDAVRTAVSGCPTDRRRLQAAIREYARTAAASPATARFWLRMSGYFSDEIGQPGELTRLRQEYLEQLAATIGDVKVEALAPGDLELASVVDACSWAIISRAIQLDNALPDEAAFVEIVRGAVQPLLKPARSRRRGSA
jgi:AcrR family transcriptional regulator